MGADNHLPLLLILFLLLSPSLSSPPVTLPSSTPQPSAAPSAAALFVLGDSTTNCGDNTVLYPILPPNLTSFCLDSRHRFLPDLIADRMGLPPIPLFYGGNFTTEGLIHGVNFGSTPATIIAGDGTASAGDRMFLGQGLSQQVAQAREVLQLINLDLGPAAAHHVVAASVFVLSFGTDDYVDLFTRGGPTAVGLKFGRRGIARVLVSQMVRAIKDLYNANVRKIVCMGVGPLGCAPHIVVEGVETLQGRSCIEEVNEVVSSYNSKLANRVLKLNTQLPGLQIVFCDTYRGIMEIISNPSFYGFKDVRNACCGIGKLGAVVGCLTPEMACADSSTHIWWDFYATTQAVNILVANWSWLPPGSHLQICSPITLHQLASS